MFEAIKTKKGDVLWIKISENCGRHEIARMQFATWQRRLVREEIKILERKYND